MVDRCDLCGTQKVIPIKTCDGRTINITHKRGSKLCLITLNKIISGKLRYQTEVNSALLITISEISEMLDQIYNNISELSDLALGLVADIYINNATMAAEIASNYLDETVENKENLLKEFQISTVGKFISFVISSTDDEEFLSKVNDNFEMWQKKMRESGQTLPQ
jgi:hypothetical protein